MREVIGHTRRGSEIWISLERIQGSIVIEELASFSEVDEEFDCICALEAFAVRPSARDSGGMAGEVLEQLSEELDRKVRYAFAKGVLDSGGHSIGSNSTDRVRHGRSLLRVEYRR